MSARNELKTLVVRLRMEPPTRELCDEAANELIRLQMELVRCQRKITHPNG